MKISVVIPTFNRSHSLARALTSVYGQTRLPDEVIVVDDCSSDDTKGVVERFAGTTFIRLEKNGGAANARNVGITQASGNYVAFLDSDDFWLCNKLELQEDYIQNNPDTDLLVGGVVVRESNGNVTCAGYDSLSGCTDWTLREFQSYAFATPSWIVKRASLLTAGLFDTSMPNSEDFDLLARMVGRYRIDAIPDPLVMKFNGSDSLDMNLEKLAGSFSILLQRHRNLWAAAPSAMTRSVFRLTNMYMRAARPREARGLILLVLKDYPRLYRLWGLYFFAMLGQRGYFKGMRWVRRN